MKKRVSCAMLLALVVSSTILAATFFEDFSTMPSGACYPDGFLIGMWQFVYGGLGCSGFVSSGGNLMLFEQPKPATRPDETHAALVVGPSITGDFAMEAWTTTTRQLRTGSAANPGK
jgi:hypothetical protein